jgi:hypothetical protein
MGSCERCLPGGPVDGVRAPRVRKFTLRIPWVELIGTTGDSSRPGGYETREGALGVHCFCQRNDDLSP